MKGIILDYSAAGWDKAIKKFAVDLFKTFLAAGISAIIVRLGDIHVPVTYTHAAELTMALALIRAFLSSAVVWLTTAGVITPKTETIDTPVATDVVAG